MPSSLHASSDYALPYLFDYAWHALSSYARMTSGRFWMFVRRAAGLYCYTWLTIELTGTRERTTSAPDVPDEAGGFRSIIRFSVETAGHFDRDAELKIWLSGTPAPLQLQFNKKLNIYEVQAVLASYVLR